MHTGAKNIDRRVASSMNPIISTISTKDTLTNCANLVRAVGHVVEAADANVCSQMFMFTGVIAAAIDYENQADEAN